LLDVLTAVELDHESLLTTEEITHEWTYRNLAAELEPAELPAPQAPPQPLLSLCRVIP
jgi:hypothetical protein